MSYTDMVKRSGGLQSAFTAVARIPKPVVAAVNGYALGGGLRAGAVRRHPDRGGRRHARSARGPPRHHPRRRRHPAADPAGGSQPGQGPDLHGPLRQGRRGAGHRAGRQGRARPPRCTTPRWRGRASSATAAGVRRPGGQGAASTAASRWTSRPAWRSSASSSRHSSRPRTVPSACSRSLSRGRARLPSWDGSPRARRQAAGDHPLTTPRPRIPEGHHVAKDDTTHHREVEEEERPPQRPPPLARASPSWSGWCARCARWRCALGALLVALKANTDNALVVFIKDAARRRRPRCLRPSRRDPEVRRAPTPPPRTPWSTGGSPRSCGSSSAASWTGSSVPEPGERR